MNTITFDPAAFRAMFPRWASTGCPTDTMLEMWFATASMYVSPDLGCSCFSLTDDQRGLALNLMTAHVGYMWDAAAKGQPTGIVTSATIDKVTVTAKAPPIADNSMFQYWLAQSPFGEQLLAMLGMIAAGGLYVGGSPERGAFRRVGGGFGAPWPGRGC